MAEYIEREALIQQMADNFRQGVWDGCDRGEYQIAENTILEAPAADVVERKRGEWKVILDDYDCELMICSCCKAEFYDGDNDTIDHLHNFCPNCGADMRGEEHGMP